MRDVSRLGLFAILLLLSGCHLMPAGDQQKKIGGRYLLEKQSDGSVWCIHRSWRKPHLIDIAAPVIRVGISDSVALIQSNPDSEGNNGGYWIIEIESRQISGPFNEQIMKDMPLAAGIELKPIEEFWK